MPCTFQQITNLHTFSNFFNVIRWIYLRTQCTMFRTNRPCNDVKCGRIHVTLNFLARHFYRANQISCNISNPHLTSLEERSISRKKTRSACMNISSCKRGGGYCKIVALNWQPTSDLNLKSLSSMLFISLNTLKFHESAALIKSTYYRSGEIMFEQCTY